MAFDGDGAAATCGAIDSCAGSDRGDTWECHGADEPDWRALGSELLAKAREEDTEWATAYREGHLHVPARRSAVEQWLAQPEVRESELELQVQQEIERRRERWEKTSRRRLTRTHRQLIEKRGFNEKQIRWMFERGFVRSLTWIDVENNWLKTFPKARQTKTGGLLLCFDPYNPSPEKRTYSLRCDEPPTEERRTGLRPAKYLYAAGGRDPLSGEFSDEHGNPRNAQQPFVPNGLIGPDGVPFGEAGIATEGLFDALACTLLLGVPCVGLTAPGHLRGSELPKSVRAYIGDADQWMAPGLLPTVVGQCVSKGLALARLPLREGHDYRVKPRDLHPDAKAGMEELHADLGPEKARETVLAITADARIPGEYLQWEIDELKALGLKWPENDEAIYNLISAIADAHKSSTPKRQALKDRLREAFGVSKSATYEGVRERLKRIQEREITEAKRKREAQRQGLLSKGITPPPEIEPDNPSNQQLQEFLDFKHEIRCNELTRLIELDGKPITEPGLSYQLLAQLHGIEARKEQAIDALNYIGRRNAYNPVAEYLKRVADNTSIEPITTRELAALFGIAPEDGLSLELLWRSLAGTALRGLTPGSKFDQCPILVGEQGLGKTEALKALAGPDWYDVLGDQKDLSLDSWAVAAKMNRCWLLEIGEVGRLTRGKHADELKVWLSSTNARYAEKNQPNATDHPKRAVPWGTTNDDQLLNDPTGTRRYWMIHITRRTDWDGIAEARDRIWRTVQLWMRQGLTVWLNIDNAEERHTLQAAARRGAEASYDDPWLDVILKYLEGVEATQLRKLRGVKAYDITNGGEAKRLVHVTVEDANGNPVEAPLVTCSDLLAALQIDPRYQAKRDTTRVGIQMRSPEVKERGWRQHRTNKLRGYVWLPLVGGGDGGAPSGSEGVTHEGRCHQGVTPRCQPEKPWHDLDLKPGDTSLLEKGG